MKSIISSLKRALGIQNDRRRNANQSQMNSPEALETRQVLSVANAYLSGGALIIVSDNSSTQVSVNSVNSNIQLRETNTNRTWDYSASSVREVRFHGGSAADRFVNNVRYMPTKAWGNAGDDYLEGYSAVDEFYGGSGNDTLRGYGGNDILHGEAGNDTIYGDSGNDDLYGGTGTDKLYGGAGNDGLFGGIGETDRLEGGSGKDRFLQVQTTRTERESYYRNGLDRIFGRKSYRNVTKTVHEDTIVDGATEDATVLFRNAGAQTFNFSGGRWTSFAAGQFTDSDIVRIDVGLQQIHDRTGGTRLLETSNGKSMTFQRLGAQTGGNFNAAGVNSTGGVITVVNATFSGNVASTVVHEVGHNWDDASESGSIINQFRALSGWTTTPISVTGFSLVPIQSQSIDGSWYYNGDAQFAREYSRTNPHEDWATSWETYFANYSSRGTGVDSRSPISAKLNVLDQFFSRMA